MNRSPPKSSVNARPSATAEELVGPGVIEPRVSAEERGASGGFERLEGISAWSAWALRIRGVTEEDDERISRVSVREDWERGIHQRRWTGAVGASKCYLSKEFAELTIKTRLGILVDAFCLELPREVLRLEEHFTSNPASRQASRLRNADAQW
jgi:hypothetical protein